MQEAAKIRLLGKVDKCGSVPPHRPDLGPCWIYTGGAFTNGYGAFWFDGKTRRAHRVAWKLFRDDAFDLNDPVLVCHACDNPICVNYERHLFVGTSASNMADRDAKGRHGQSRKTHCSQGHPFTPENTYIVRGKYRHCVTCKSASMKRWTAGRGQSYQRPIIRCVGCGQDRPHKGHGLCHACNERRRRQTT